MSAIRPVLANKSGMSRSKLPHPHSGKHTVSLPFVATKLYCLEKSVLANGWTSSGMADERKFGCCRHVPWLHRRFVRI